MIRAHVTAIASLIVLIALPLAAEARHSCGSSTRTQGNCTITTTTLCEYRTDPNGRRQEYIVGTQTSKSCAVTDAVNKATRSMMPDRGSARPVTAAVPFTRMPLKMMR